MKNTSLTQQLSDIFPKRTNNGVYNNFRKLPVPGKWKRDGLDHINISSIGETDLGRTLHPNTMLPFTHDVMGEFGSLSAFWGFMETGAGIDRIRYLNTPGRLKLLREITRYKVENISFFIVDANWQRICKYPGLQLALIESKLPFDTYMFEGEHRVPQRRGNAAWLIEGQEIIRDALIKNEEPDFSVFMSGKTREELFSGFIKKYLGNSNNFTARKEDEPNVLLAHLLEGNDPSRKRRKFVEVPLKPVVKELSEQEQAVVVETNLTVLDSNLPIDEIASTYFSNETIYHDPTVETNTTDLTTTLEQSEVVVNVPEITSIEVEESISIQANVVNETVTENNSVSI